MIVTYGRMHMEQDEPETNSEDSESDPTKSISFLNSYFSQTGRSKWSPERREEFFYLWYNNGRPKYQKFIEMFQEKFPKEEVPSEYTVGNWLAEYRARAFAMDAKVHQEVEAAVIAEKIEMLKRHAVTGVKMEDIALEYINAHRGDMSMPAAIRLLVEGVRIERESRGIPEALEKMLKMTDEQLLAEVKQIISSSPVSVEGTDANS